MRSTFSNFLYGINSIDVFIYTATFSVKNSTFLNNYYGIYAGAVNNAIVESDSFRIYQTTCTGSCTKPTTYGLYLDNCTGYQVQDNYFTKYGSTTPTNSLYGIIANNSGAHANAIFRNIFKNLYTGCQAQYINYIYQSGTPHNSSGLLYQCNTFSAGSIKNADIYVPDYTSGVNISNTTYSSTPAGIQYAQGSGGSSGYPATADNLFSHSGSSAYDFYIDSTAYAYNSNYEYYCTSSCPGGAGNLYPARRKNISAAPVNTTTVVCSSTSPYSNGYRTSDPLLVMQNHADAYKQTYDSLVSLIDGGNTTSLLALVSGNNNHQAVLNSLTQVAPYISDGVLIAYINSNYPAADINQILSACSPLTDNVNTALKASNLSGGLKSQLAAQQNGTSKLFSLHAEMGAVFSSRHLILNELVRTYMHDTIQTNIQKGYALMKTQALELPARSQFETALSLHDSAMAANALTQVANQEGQSNYVSLSTILLQNLSNPNLMNNSSVVSTLQAMATDSSDRLGYMKVNMLLQSVGKSTYIPYIQPFPIATNTQGQSERTMQVAQVAPAPILSASTLVNSPNPFKENTLVKAVIFEKTQNAYIVITDMVGNEIARYTVQQGENNINVNAGSLDQAVMFCTLVVDGVKIKTNKMVLIK